MSAKIKSSWLLGAAFAFMLLYVCLVTLALASEKGHESEVMAPFSLSTEIWRYINFALIFAMVFFLIRKPLGAFFVKHKAKVANEIEDAGKAKEQAMERLKEYETRLAHFDEEIAQIKAEAEQQKEEIKEQLLREADAAIAKIMAQTRQHIESERRKAIHDIRIEAAELTISMSEEILRKNVQKKDQERLINDYLNQVGGLN